MTPTPKLRFVERSLWDAVKVRNEHGDEEWYPKPAKKNILQQWWAVERDGQITPTGEWRDVPLEAA
jgi:hypothetical protein